jgi:nucleotide-binding universal stress UspA family protein
MTTDTETESAQAQEQALPIVVGVDGSSTSAAALERAARIAQALDSEVVAVGTWEWPTSYGGYLPPEWSPEEDCRHIVDDTVAAVFGSTPPPQLRTEILEGNAARVLIDLSTSAQMLVVGSRGHGGFTGLLLGSVSSACAEHAECPVLVYHGPGITVPSSAAVTR